MRVLGFRRKGGPSFLARVDFPLSVAVDVNDVPALYVVPHKSGWLDREPLVDKTQRLLNGLAGEFDVRTTAAVPPAYAPAHAYSCRYADASLPVLVDNLLSVRIRGRVILSLEPRKAWRAGFLVGTDAPADAVLGPLFSDVRDVRPRDLCRVERSRLRGSRPRCSTATWACTAPAVWGKPTQHARSCVSCTPEASRF